MTARPNPTRPRTPPGNPGPKPGLHPRNRHRDRYPFPALVAASPELAPFVAVNAHGDPSIDFANPEAVKALNRALLKHFYRVDHWDLPQGFLCPPIPGRVDYLHHAADLLARDADGALPRGHAVRVLDIGVGANCIYPLLGQSEYGWRFLGSDIDAAALAHAQRILDANPGLKEAIRLRRQPDPAHILQGLLREGERFHLTLCNPPFHASAQEARQGSERKWRNLGRSGPGPAPVLNFGGRDAELCCPGGEGAFVERLIQESAPFGGQVLWFTSLVAKEANLPRLLAALKRAGVLEHQVLGMAQGQKRSRLLAWTFQDREARRAGLGTGAPLPQPRPPKGLPEPSSRPRSRQG